MHVFDALVYGVYSAWSMVLDWYMLEIPVTPVAIGAHTSTKLHELNTALDASRRGWRCK